MPASTLVLDLFATAPRACSEPACLEQPRSEQHQEQRSPTQAATAAAPALAAEDLEPTWSEESRIFHTTSKCTRLQAIRRNRRVSGKPGLREHCLNCIDITATKRRG